MQYIRLVIKKTRCRRSVGRDVQAELAAHFEDELKGCATEQEKEQSAQELIEKFGDAKLLAVLLRRAKKRCRPLWRSVVARIFQAVGILIVCLVLYVIWFYSGEPVITTNYLAELNSAVRPVPDEILNAAPIYDQAIQKIKTVPDEISELLGERYDEATPQQRQRMQQWLRDNRELFELLAAGAQKPYYWTEYKTEDDTAEMMAVLVPELQYFRRLAFALRWWIWTSAEQDRYEDAFRGIKSLYCLGQHLKEDKTLIEQLVGIAIEALASGTLRQILSDHTIGSATLAQLQEELEQIVADENFTISLKAERLVTYDVIQRSFTAGLGGGHIIPKSLEQLFPEVTIISSEEKNRGPASFIYDVGIILRKFRKWCYILFLHPDKQETFRVTGQFYDYWEKVAAKTPAQVREEQTDIKEQARQIIRGNILLEGMVPAIERMSLQCHSVRASVEAMITIMATLRYEKSSGRYPDDLEELVMAGYLKELPIDPYSDGPLLYKRTQKGFLLYSVGPNFEDDGGQIFYSDRGRPISRGTNEEGDWVFWPVLKSGEQQ
jgi:hypothetical protein